MCVQAFCETLSRAESVTAFDAYAHAPTLEARRHVFAVLRAAAELAHHAVRAEAARDKSRHQMGCTLDAVVLLLDRAFAVHVGDGRAYLARPATGTTIQLTTDHNLHGSLLARGLVSPTERVPERNPLTSAIGVSTKLTIDVLFVDLDPGDRLLLCTDGVHGLLGDEAAVAQRALVGTPEDAVRALIGGALERGGIDNATAVVVEVGQRANPRRAYDGGLKARDLTAARLCPLLVDLPDSLVLRALSASVELELSRGELLPRFLASDRVAYIVLDGEVDVPGGVTLGTSALLYPESLMNAGQERSMATARTHVRALRLRSDDFREVCASDVNLAAILYERLARQLAWR